MKSIIDITVNFSLPLRTRLAGTESILMASLQGVKGFPTRAMYPSSERACKVQWHQTGRFTCQVTSHDIICGPKNSWTLRTARKICHPLFRVCTVHCRHCEAYRTHRMPVKLGTEHFLILNLLSCCRVHYTE